MVKKIRLSFFIFLLILLFLTNNVKAVEYKAIVDITTLDVYEIQQAIDKKYLTYELLINLYLDRIKTYNQQYNAIININEKAIDETKKLDKEYQEKGRRSLLHGIPIIVKDNIDYVGLPTTGGAKALSDSYPKKNAPIIQNLIDAGAIIIGKSNMSEFAFSAYSSYSSYGNVRNAYNLEYTPYGSSGGSAVSVAASFVPLALGTDTNSSIRLPASANNIVGLRPTYGLLSNDGIIPYDAERDTAGPMSKTVRDNAMLLTILANNGIDYTIYLKEDGLKDKKIGVLTQFIKKNNSVSIPNLSYYYDEIERLMNEAIKVMEDKGAKIVYINDFYSSYYYNLNNNTKLHILFCYDFNKYIKNTTSKIKSFNDLLNDGRFVQKLNDYNYSCYNDLRNTRLSNVNKLKDEYRNYVKNVMNKYDVDVLVYPATKNKLLKLSEIATKSIANNTSAIAPTTGFPEISIPIGFDKNYFPYSLEILSLPNQEGLLYEIGYAFEQATNHRKNPTIAPNLYLINDKISALIKYYENKITYKNYYDKNDYKQYLNTYNKIENLIINYNNYDDNTLDDYVTELIKECSQNIKNLLLTDKSITTNTKDDIYPIIFVVVLIIILEIINYFIKKNKKDTKIKMHH